MEIWQHDGEPDDEEIQQWMEVDGDLSDHLAIRHPCPTCRSNRTRWVRQQYCICYNCESSFSVPPLGRSEDSGFWSQFDE